MKEQQLSVIRYGASTDQGRRKVNQDQFLVESNLGGREDTYLFAVSYT
jgi:serine/threonine protein phosphatase PrpC